MRNTYNKRKESIVLYVVESVTILFQQFSINKKHAAITTVKVMVVKPLNTKYLSDV